MYGRNKGVIELASLARDTVSSVMGRTEPKEGTPPLIGDMCRNVKLLANRGARPLNQISVSLDVKV